MRRLPRCWRKKDFDAGSTWLLLFDAVAGFRLPLTEAAIVHGTVTDPLGLPVIHASVVLVQNGQILALALTRTDGSYQISSSASGRFYVLTSASNFKQITSLSFYAGAVDSHEEDVVLEPANVRQEIVTSVTGTPLPEAQVSAAVTVRRNAEFRNRLNLVDPLRQIPGVFVLQQGQYGGPASLFIRGGNSDANEVNLDGVPIINIGGQFDFSNLSTAGVGQFEVYRGPNSVLYGSDAAAGVVSLSTPRGSTPFPSFSMKAMPAVTPAFAIWRSWAAPTEGSIITPALTASRATTT